MSVVECVVHAAFSLDGGDSPAFAARRGSLGGRGSYARRCAHEFAREGGYDRDTSFYSEMAATTAAAAPQTSIRGLNSKSLDCSRAPRLSSGMSFLPLSVPSHASAIR